MPQLPNALYRAAQVRELDRSAIEHHGIPGTVLMGRAGAAAFASAHRRWPEARRLAILCGAGNNGGDGYVVAHLALAAGLEVELFHLVKPDRLTSSAREAAAAAHTAGVPMTPYRGQSLAGYDLIFDALLGTGLDRAVGGEWATAITAMNSSGVPIVALDLPSGLYADTGAVAGEAAVRAQLTVTFIGLKLGLFTGAGPDHCGEIEFEDLEVPAAIYALPPAAQRLSQAHLSHWLTPRPRTAHKGHFGHVLVVGGDRGMGGAVRLAAEAAARVGAGLVSIATHPFHANTITANRPELMVHGIEQAAELEPLLARATVVALGPGLGRNPWGRALLTALLASPLPLVVDADALNLLAESPQQRQQWVLTPHPGEAGRLLGISSAEIEQDRPAAAAALCKRYGATVVLKGAGTLVATAESLALCTAGNPGMASGGMGDLLTGVIAGLMAGGLAPTEAATIGVCLHAAAADRAAQEGGERGLLALDLMPHLRHLANP